MAAARKRRGGRAAAAPAPLRVRPAASLIGDKPLLAAVAAVLLLLAAVADDRHVGLIADGRQIIRTAVAIVETGGIGQARGRDFTWDRGDDAVSRFGMGTSLLQIPAAWLAPHVESGGAGRSQALFLLVPWLALGVAAAAAGSIARALGASDLQVIAAVLLASIAGPLGSYAHLEFSEPVQAAALAWALAAAFAASRSQSSRPRAELAAGFAAGFAVLTKSSLILAAPAALLPLVDPRDLPRTRRALARAAAGAAVPLAAWVAFELTRFGALFGGYPDDRFTHPWLDGLWRLLVGANRGLLLFWPALALSAWSMRRFLREGWWSPAARAGTAAFLVLAVQIAVAAGYWGWHGMEGWGPRLIVSALPLLAPFAAVAARPLVVGAITALCVILNLLPLLQHPTPVATYIMNVTWPEIPEAERWRYPFYATAQSSSGRPTVIPFEVLEETPAANPWRTYLWFWRASRQDPDELEDALSRPPWTDAQPQLRPPATLPPAALRQIALPPRLGFLGRSLTGTGGPYATVYLDALLDQAVRANQQGNIERALQLSAKRFDLAPGGEAAAWRLESLRRAGRAAEAESLLRSLPEATRRHPLINVVLALFDREFGEERRARALLDSVRSSFPGTPLQQALVSPLGGWPTTLDAMTRTPRRDAVVRGK